MISIFINISSLYWWGWILFKFINMNSISILVCVSLYILVSRNIFFILLSFFFKINRISLFIYIFSNYLCSWRSSFLLVDVFCITLIIFFGFYKFISFDIFFVFCSIFFMSNSLTIFINVFCNYIWSFVFFKYPCSYEVFICFIYCCICFIVVFEYPFSTFYRYFCFCWLSWSYFISVFFTCLVSWC